MNSFNIKIITVAIGLAFSAGAMAVGMTKAEYKTGQDTVAVDYKKEKEARDTCLDQAKVTFSKK